MDPVHDDHSQPHDKRVEDVEEELARYDVSVVALDIFDNSHNGSDEDENADDIQRDHVFLPWRVRALRCRVAAGTSVKDRCRDHEEAEDNNLDDKTSDDDVFAHVGGVLGVGSGKKTSTCR